MMFRVIYRDNFYELWLFGHNSSDATIFKFSSLDKLLKVLKNLITSEEKEEVKPRLQLGGVYPDVDYKFELG